MQKSFLNSGQNLSIKHESKNPLPFVAEMYSELCHILKIRTECILADCIAQPARNDAL